MRAVDVGANYGVYTLSMARAVGPGGHVWAFEPASSTVAFLRESISVNGFGNVTLVQAALSERTGLARLFLRTNAELNSLSAALAEGGASEEVAVRTLDEMVDELSLGEVDFVKLDAEGEESRIVNGGRRLFRDSSPLVMFELMHGAKMNSALIGQFFALGYDTYRLLPGLGVLVPFDPSQGRDAFQLNLFCCKRETGLQLEARGVLATADYASAASRSRISGCWRSMLGAMPFAATMLDGWHGSSGAVLPERQAYLDALDLYCLAGDAQQDARVRYGAMSESLRLLERASTAAPTPARLNTYARVLVAAGARWRGMEALFQCLQELESGKPLGSEEPFLPACPRFEQIIPTNLAEWFAAAALEQLEFKAVWSSYYAPRDCIQRVQRIFELGFGTPELERRARMSQARLHGASAT
jgi:FkbM family methyltransferase